jgi:hypothetical protein
VSVRQPPDEAEPNAVEVSEAVRSEVRVVKNVQWPKRACPARNVLHGSRDSPAKSGLHEKLVHRAKSASRVRCVSREKDVRHAKNVHLVKNE